MFCCLKIGNAPKCFERGNSMEKKHLKLKKHILTINNFKWRTVRTCPFLCGTHFCQPGMAQNSDTEARLKRKSDLFTNRSCPVPWMLMFYFWIIIIMNSIFWEAQIRELWRVYIYILRIPDTIPPQILHRAALGGVFSSLVAGCVQSRPASDGLRSSNNFTEDFWHDASTRKHQLCPLSLACDACDGYWWKQLVIYDLNVPFDPPCTSRKMLEDLGRLEHLLAAQRKVLTCLIPLQVSSPFDMGWTAQSPGGRMSSWIR